MSARRGLAPLLAVAAAGATSASCAILLGVDDLEPVDCVGACDGERDGASPSADGSRETGVSDARVDITSCDAGAVTLSVTVSGVPGSVDVDPGGGRVVNGERLVVCLPVGTDVRLETSSSAADFAGAACESGDGPDRCDFTLRAPTVVTVTLR